MPSTENNNKAGSTKQQCPLEEDTTTEEEPRVSIRANVFFDGTGNNRANVNAGPDGAPFDPSFIRTDSYEADHSNISKLQSLWKKSDKEKHYTLSVYVEGIGTHNNRRDSLVGSGTGQGFSGVKTRVATGLKRIINSIDKLGTNKKISYIHLDTFGFSRGAAAARYFVYYSMQKAGKTLLEQLKAKGYEVGSVKFKFVGLFDTVASFGISHDEDTKQLHLDCLGQTERTVHLCAAEEHREKFRLTNIKSASNGLEIFLPGVHSDIGGGYTAVSKDDKLQIYDIDVTYTRDVHERAFQRETNWLLASGWYKNKNSDNKSDIEKANFFNEIKVSRKKIGNQYSFIPLRIMAKHAKENGIKISGRLAIKHKLPKDLTEFYGTLKAYIAKGNTKPEHWHLDFSDQSHFVKHNDEKAREIRYKYFHFSSYYGSVGMAPQWTNNDPIKGKRKRVIQKG